jgi:Lar family restriction alleviation protein
MGKVTTVGGLEQFVGNKGKGSLYTAPPGVLSQCPFCGHEAAFKRSRDPTVPEPHVFSVHCSNTSCGIHTPEHYKSEADAAQAWNRRLTVV